MDGPCLPPLLFRPVPSSYVLLFLRIRLDRCVTGDRSFKDRPRLLPRAIALSHIPPFRLQSIPPLKEGGMLADLESSVSEHLPSKRDARRFGVVPSLNWGDIYIPSSNPWWPKRNSRRFGIHELVDSHYVYSLLLRSSLTYLVPFQLFS